MSRSAEISLHLHPKQGEALTTVATEVLFGGAAGGGKSHLMRVAAILWCASIPGLQVYLFRRMSADLIKTHMMGPKGFPMLLAPWVLGGLVKIVESEIRFWNGSRIFLCHCKDEKDRFNFLGAEMHVLLIDELTTFTDVIYRFLRGRLRMIGLTLPPEYVGHFPRILCSSNPGGIGHGWVKSQFIDGLRPMELKLMPPLEGGKLRQFIPALMGDNPSLMIDAPDYANTLSGLGSEALVKAMRDGDWNVVAGAYFDCWSTEKHVIKPFAPPKHWMKFGSFDWGSAKPFSMGWWAVSDGSVLPDGRRYPTGAMIRYREWYGASEPNVGLKMRTDEIAAGIKRREAGEDISYRVADPACWDSSRGPSIAEQMATSESKVMFRPADNKRIAGWSQMRDRLMGDEAPMLLCFDTCTDFIRTVPALQHDDKRPEDLDSDGEDHAADDGRYACMSRPYTRKAPSNEPIRGVQQMTMEEAWKLGRIKQQDNPRI